MASEINVLEKIYQQLKRKRIVLNKTEYAAALGFSRAQLYRLYDDLPSIPDELIEKAKSLNIETNYVQHETNASEHTPKYVTGNEIPYYLYSSATAGLNFLGNNSDTHFVHIKIPNVDADAFINVFGDSMHPLYSAGEIIGIKRIAKEDVMFGHAYVIQIDNSEAYIKYIKKGRDDEHWILASENKKYESKEFHVSKVSKIYIIKAVITKTTL